MIPDDALDRRGLLQSLAALGIGGAVFQRAAAANAADPPAKVDLKAVTAAMVEQAEWVAGVTLTDAERKDVARTLTRELAGRAAAEQVKLPNAVPPAFHFQPGPAPPVVVANGPVVSVDEVIKPGPKSEGDDLAFAGVAALGRMIRAKQVSSVELTKLALARLRKYDPALLCVVSFTEEIALKQAKQADEDLAAGNYHGPLHGLPWGAKDLISYPGTKTTFGAGHYKDQTLDAKAAVADRLDRAGCVLTAKLTLGALALGDKWFGGMTRNPWNVTQGSSGSSAGPAAAVVAGLVPFAIGSETLGSIVSPSTRCGATGLRPTFGRVSRAGCMTLAWTMDKVGPMARSVEDCALVFAAIHGADPADAAAVSRPFAWPSPRPLKEMRVGYVEGKKSVDERAELKVLKLLGVKLVPIKLPAQYPQSAMSCILDAECAAAFDDITREGVTEGIGPWRGTFLRGRFTTAVDYIRANRVRTLVMRAMNEVMAGVDLYVGGNDLFLTNMTGHPTVCLPNGFRKDGDSEVPTALTFTGRLYGEAELLAVAHAYQVETGHHRRRPPMDKVTKENAGL